MHAGPLRLYCTKHTTQPILTDRIDDQRTTMALTGEAVAMIEAVRRDVKMGSDNNAA